MIGEVFYTASQKGHGKAFQLAVAWALALILVAHVIHSLSLPIVITSGVVAVLVDLALLLEYTIGRSCFMIRPMVTS